MNWLIESSGPSQVLPILLDSALKGAVVIAFAAGAAWLLRHNTAAARHSVWSAAIAAQLILPLMVIALPTWQVPLLDAPAWVTPSPEPSATPAPGGATSTPPAEQPAAPERVADGASARNAAPSGAQEGGQPAATTDVASFAPIAIVFVIWLLGCVAVLARLALGTAVVARLAGKGERVVDEKWLGLLHRLAVTLGINRPLTLLRGESLAVPVTWGIVYPVVLLPVDADNWPEERRHYVLVHEMAHVKRFDAFTQLVSQFVLAIYWFNPLTWVATAQMRRERENACDDYVITHGTKPSLYASDLLELVREIDTDGHRVAAPAFAALAMARRSEFEGRMLSILDPRLRRNGLTRKGVIMGLLTMFMIAAPLAAFSPYAPERAVTIVDSPQSTQVLIAGGDPVASTRPASQEPLPALRPKRASTSTSFEGCETASNSTVNMTSINSHGDGPEDRTVRFIQRRPGRCLEAKLEGVVEFTDDERDVATLGRGASVRFFERATRGDHELSITSEGGRQHRVYQVNGVVAEVDDAGREWLASMILTLVRETGYKSGVRVRRLHELGGTARVLAEIDAIQSSSAKRDYYAGLFEIVRTFDDTTLTRILSRIQRDFAGSSGDLRSILEQVPVRSVRTAQARAAFAGAIERIDSDGDKSAMIGVLIPTADRDLLLAIMEVAITIESDGDKAGLLVAGAASYLNPKDQQLRETFFRVAESIESDGDLARVLRQATPFGHADSEVAAAVIRATREIESDGDKADVLTQIATQRLLTTKALKDAYLEAARTIESDGDRARVLRAAMLD